MDPGPLDPFGSNTASLPLFPMQDRQDHQGQQDRQGQDQPGQDDDQQPPGGIRGNKLFRLAGKLGWNLIDQVLSSGTNAVLSILVARNASVAGFGAFSVAFLLFSLCIAIERALAGQVFSIRYAAADPERIRRAAARGLGTVLLFGLASGAVVAGAGLVLGGDLRGPLLAVGVTMAALLMQDTCRMVFFAQSRSHLAALNDALWAVVQFSLMGVALAVGWTDPGVLTLLWGASSAVCVLLGVIQLRAVPDPRAAPGWVREHRDLLGYLLPETLVTSGGDKAAYLMVGGILSAAAVGAVNAARQLLNPLLIISQAAASFAMPEISRRSQLSEKARWQAGVGLGAVVGAISLVYVGLVLLVPDVAGEQLFGATWKQAHQVLLPMGLFSAAAGMCLGPFIVIAAMGHARRTFRVTVLQTVLMLILMPLGALLGDVTGATWGLFIGKLIELPFWLRALRTASAEGPVQHVDQDADGGPDGGAPEPAAG